MNVRNLRCRFAYALGMLVSLSACASSANVTPGHRDQAEVRNAAVPTKVMPPFVGPYPAAAADWIAAVQASAPLGQGRFRLRVRPNKVGIGVFLSGNLTGNVDLYQTDGQLAGQCEGCGGWGLAAYGRAFEIAMGLDGGLVTVWQLQNFALHPIATLALSRRDKRAEALGLAFDRAGDVFASNYPANTIDEFTAATIKSGGGPADVTFAVREFSEIYYLASNGDDLFVDGWDGANNFIVVEVNIKGSRMQTKLLQTLGSLSAGTGFPGGLTLDPKQNLLVNNQYAGTISEFGKPYTGQPTSILNWVFNPNDYTGIFLDSTRQTVWAANVTTTGSQPASFGVANSYPLGSIGESTQPTVTDHYVGVAVGAYDGY